MLAGKRQERREENIQRLEIVKVVAGAMLAALGLRTSWETLQDGEEVLIL